MKTLLFDGQVFQSQAWFRGMGKYSLELIKSVVDRNEQTHQWDEVGVIFSSNKDVDPVLLDALSLLKSVRVHRIDLDPNDILNPLITSTHNRKAVDEFVETLEGEVAYVILSLMQGEISPTFPSSPAVMKSVVFYDLIPLMFFETYLQNPITRKEYLSKLEELLLADIFFAISKTVANDLAVYLGIDPKRIVSINGGPIAHDTKAEAFEVPEHFVLMPTGNDLRKNNRNGIEGFNIFNKKHGGKYSLVITSYFEQWQIDELSLLSDNLIFTGNIPGSKLNYLYKKADLLLFPSLYEGLGLPVLEALENDLSVACSDITVFKEISHDAFAFFDPYDIHAIARSMEDALKKDISKNEAKHILNIFSWADTARIFGEFFQQIEPTKEALSEVIVVTPSLSGESHVGKLILQSHASLHRVLNLQYYTTSGGNRSERRIDYLPYITDTKRLSLGNRLEIHGIQNKQIIYHLDKSNESIPVVLLALANPGVLILHDTDLRGLWSEMKDSNVISPERFELERKINAAFEVKGLYWVASLVSKQHAVIVFSERTKNLLDELVKLTGSTTLIHLLDLPANNLVYLDIIGQTTGKSIDLAELENLTDMQYEVSLSHAKELKYDKKDTSTDSLLAVTESEKYHSGNQSGYEEYARALYDRVNTEMRR